MDVASLVSLSSDGDSRRGSWQWVRDDEPGDELDAGRRGQLSQGDGPHRPTIRIPPVHVNLSDVDVSTTSEDGVSQPDSPEQGEQLEHNEALDRRLAAAPAVAAAALLTTPPSRRPVVRARTAPARRRQPLLVLALLKRRHRHEAELARQRQCHEWKVAVFKCSVAAVVTFLAVRQVYKCAKNLRAWFAKQFEWAVAILTQRVESLATEQSRAVAELLAAAKKLDLAMAQQTRANEAYTNEVVQKAVAQMVRALEKAVEAAKHMTFWRRSEYFRFLATDFVGRMSPLRQALA